MCVCSQASHVPLHLGAPPTELEVPLRVGVHAADSGHRRAVVVEARRAALARALELRRVVLARAVETAGGLASLGLGLGLGVGVGVKGRGRVRVRVRVRIRLTVRARGV